MSVFEIIIKYSQELLQGLGVTLKLCLFIFPIGIIAGIFLGIARHKWKYFVGIPANILGLILSSTPIIVFLFWLHYPLQYIMNIVVDPFKTSVFALSMVLIFMVSVIIRNSLDDFPKELLQAAQVCGLSNNVTIFEIQLPLIYRQTLPSVLVALIYILQATLFTSLISVNEIFRIAQQINAEIYKPVEIYTALAIFFVIICAVLNLLAYWLKSRYKYSISNL
jgi:ABC-type amino acid transport system permease subunit